MNSSSWRRLDRDEEPRRRVVRMKPAARPAETAHRAQGRGGRRGCRGPGSPSAFGHLRKPPWSPGTTSASALSLRRGVAARLPLGAVAALPEDYRWRNGLGKPSAGRKSLSHGAGSRAPGPKARSNRPKHTKIALVSVSASYRYLNGRTTVRITSRSEPYIIFFSPYEVL
jgi:hypothetical protein